jgi:hypothetical protein
VTGERRVRADRLRRGDRVKLEGDFAESGWCRVGGVLRAVSSRPDCSGDGPYTRLLLTTECGLVIDWLFYSDSLVLRG